MNRNLLIKTKIHFGWVRRVGAGGTGYTYVEGFGLEKDHGADPLWSAYTPSSPEMLALPPRDRQSQSIHVVLKLTHPGKVILAELDNSDVYCQKECHRFSNLRRSSIDGSN
jgi:hypothetical protein